MHVLVTGPILKKKRHMCNFSEKGQKKVKKGKMFKNSGKNVPNLKNLEKGQLHVCDYHIARNS